MAKKKLLLAAMIVGALAVALLVVFVQTERSQYIKKDGPKATVVMAAGNIPAGTPLEPGLVTYAEVPEMYLPPNPIFEGDAPLFLGATLTVNVEAGTYIQTSDFARTEIARDLSSKVLRGERAMSIPVDNISGVSGLLKAGDRVDILATFPVTQDDQLIPGQNGNTSVGYVTMSLLQNVTLLAVGQQLSEINAQGNGRSGYSSVTPSLTVQEAELITIAQTRGKLTLLLRNVEDIKVEEGGKMTLKGVLENLGAIQKIRTEKVEQREKKKVRKPTKPDVVIRGGSGAR